MAQTQAGKDQVAARQAIADREKLAKIRARHEQVQIEREALTKQLNRMVK